jgi:tetratricopeptide (TPR) repeat protein
MVLEALALQERHGLRGLDYARGLGNLGDLRFKSGDVAGGEKLYRESLRIKQGLPTVDDSDLAFSLHNLGTLLANRGVYDRAEPLLVQARELRTRVSGGKPTVALSMTLGALATLREDQERYDEAQLLYEEAVTMRRAIYPDGSPALALILNNMGRFFERRGQLDRAEAALREAVQIADKMEDFPPADRASYQRNLASILAAQGKGAEAERLAREVVAAYRERGARPSKLAHFEGPLGSALAAQKRYSEAESLLTAAYAALLPETENNARQVTEMRRRLFDLYTAWGKPAKAAKYRAES